MFSGIALNLLGSWRLWLLAAAVAAFLGVSHLAAVRGREIRALQAEKATLETRLATISEQVREQNAAVERLAAASKRQAAAVRQAQERAKTAQERAKANAEALALAEVPKSCPEALEWLRGTVDQAEASRGAR